MAKKHHPSFPLHVEGLRQGIYADKYFVNIALILAELSRCGYEYAGKAPNAQVHIPVEVGDLEVEMQVFTRRKGEVVVCGVEESVAMLRAAAGYYDSEGRWVGTFENLEVEAVSDGDIVRYDGDPRAVRPVLKIRGRYRDFAALETPMLGALARGSRVATNVYQTLIEARGKPVLFFPARFDLYQTQASDGYAYYTAVQRYNRDFQKNVTPFVSSDAQGKLWNGRGGGTIAHAMIACFLGDTAETTLAFARYAHPQISRIALVDFNNDVCRDSLSTARVLFGEYLKHLKAGENEANKYRLYGVRLDTSGNMIDRCLTPTGAREDDNGVNPRLVFALREALDNGWKEWGLSPEEAAIAEEYCKAIKIAVSGGFRPEKIRRFETLGVPVDIYAVGSYLFENSSKEGTNTDFTADVVRVKIGGQWVDMAKVGRGPCQNPDLRPVRRARKLKAA